MRCIATVSNGGFWSKYALSSPKIAMCVKKMASDVPLSVTITKLFVTFFPSYGPPSTFIRATIMSRPEPAFLASAAVISIGYSESGMTCPSPAWSAAVIRSPKFT